MYLDVLLSRRSPPAKKCDWPVPDVGTFMQGDVRVRQAIS